MINLNSLIKYKEIELLGYGTEYIEQPVPDIVDFDWKKILEAPPPNTSKETFLELQLVSRSTLNRTLEETKLVEIIDQDTDSVFIELLNQYGLEYPQPKILEFYNIIKPIVLNVKSLWNRPRPSQLAKYYDLNIDVIVTDTHHTAAYPSGHTVYSSLVAHIIEYYYPTVNKQKLDSLVKDTGKARILQGVHYPSDNLASIKLTKFLFNKLKERIL
jgi:hypothetical protein